MVYVWCASNFWNIQWGHRNDFSFLVFSINHSNHDDNCLLQILPYTSKYKCMILGYYSVLKLISSFYQFLLFVLQLLKVIYLYHNIKSINISLKDSHSSIQKFCKAFPKNSHILINKIGPIKIALFDDKDKSQIFFHNSQCNNLILFIIVQLYVGFALTIVLIFILIIQVGNINKDIENIRTDIVFVLVW